VVFIINLSVYLVTTNYISNKCIVEYERKMSKNPRGTAIPGGVARSCFGGISKMNNVESVIKAFREARIAGEKLLSQGIITFDDFADQMLSFEARLRSMGVVL
jgi:hypothetical protein